jgi:hypothetical protein
LEVAKTVPADVVDEELVFPVAEAFAALPEADALPLAVEFELVLPVALAVAVEEASVAADLAALVVESVAEASVAVFFPAFVVVD